MQPSPVVSASANSTLGRCSSSSSSFRRSNTSFCSSVRFRILTALARIVFSSSSAERGTYPPVRRICGSTSEVTHLRKALAEGLRLSRITSYSPSSLTKLAICVPPLVERGSVEMTPFSSRITTPFCFSPSTLHTSARQNQGSPLSSLTVLILPNSGLSKILISFLIIFMINLNKKHSQPSGVPCGVPSGLRVQR